MRQPRMGPAHLHSRLHPRHGESAGGITYWPVIPDLFGLGTWATCSSPSSSRPGVRRATRVAGWPALVPPPRRSHLVVSPRPVIPGSAFPRRVTSDALDEEVDERPDLRECAAARKVRKVDKPLGFSDGRLPVAKDLRQRVRTSATGGGSSRFAMRRAIATISWASVMLRRRSGADPQAAISVIQARLRAA